MKTATEQKGLLAKYLYMCQHAGNEERKQLARTIPDSVRTMHNNKVVKVKELLMTESISGTNLVPTEIYRTVTRGAQYMNCFRQALPIYNTKSNAVKVPKNDSDSYAEEVAEGGEIPGITGSIGVTSYTIKKYGWRPQITRELVNDALFDVIENRLVRTGRCLENKLNQLVLTDLLDNAGNEKDTAGSAGNQGVKAIADAVALIQVDGFMPDTVVMHPQANAMVLKDFVPGNWEYTAMLNSGVVPNGVLGLKAFRCGVADASGSYAWEYDSDGDIGMLVLDSTAAAAIMMREDIKVENYFDPIRDLHNICCTQRYGYGYEQANAICRIEY